MDNEQIRKMTEALGDKGFGDTLAEVMQVLDKRIWAEDEVDRAVRKHPEFWDVLYHSVSLLNPTHGLMTSGADFIYESHVRELLGRVIKGQDTRPATSAEIVCACNEASQISPMTEVGFGTYARAWNDADFPDSFPDTSNTLRFVEGLHRDSIDAMIADLRRKLTVKDRVLSDIVCDGYRHGEFSPRCRYYKGKEGRKAS